jgi:hypothetical protein
MALATMPPSCPTTNPLRPAPRDFRELQQRRTYAELVVWRADLERRVERLWEAWRRAITYQPDERLRLAAQIRETQADLTRCDRLIRMADAAEARPGQPPGPPLGTRP